MFKETITRSLLKALIYRIFAIFSTYMIIALFGATNKVALEISIVLNITGFLLYYLCERIWNKINFGKLK